MSTPPSAPWLSSTPPWNITSPVDSSLPSRNENNSGSTPFVLSTLHGPLTPDELFALASQRYIPLFGLGPTPSEAQRAIALLSWTWRSDATPNDHTLASVLLFHPRLREKPFDYLNTCISKNTIPRAIATLALGALCLLPITNELAIELSSTFTDSRPDPRLPRLVRFTNPQHFLDWKNVHHHNLSDYCTTYLRGGISETNYRTFITCAWFDWVFARHWSGFDTLTTHRDLGLLDPATQWLIATARWLNGDRGTEPTLTSIIDSALAPVKDLFPFLVTACNTDLAELVSRPWASRWAHLQCSASRDFTNAWPALQAPPPTPKRLSRTPVIRPKKHPKDFAVNWYGLDRDLHISVDTWGSIALRVYHRLLGAWLISTARSELRL